METFNALVDDSGEIVEAEQIQTSKGLVAKVDNLYLWPNTFYVLTEAQVENIKRAELRAAGLAFI